VPIVWGGDPTTSWGFDGLSSAVIEGLTMGASGIGMWGSDCGGFFSTLDRLTPELLKRWIQFAAFSPVMRTKSQGIEVPAYVRPQVWDDEILPTWVRYTRIHAGLVDYLEHAHAEYRTTGRPIMAALELVHPDVPLLAGVADEYYFGPDLLVAPVLEPDITRRAVVVPPGTWEDAFAPDTGRLEGPAVLEVPVTVEDIPVYRRVGSTVSIAPD
jgi:alpha-glucosidase (family GH31 glycosyl hydrolase)